MDMMVMMVMGRAKYPKASAYRRQAKATPAKPQSVGVWLGNTATGGARDALAPRALRDAAPPNDRAPHLFRPARTQGKNGAAPRRSRRYY